MAVATLDKTPPREKPIAKRRRDEDHDETGPRQREAILQSESQNGASRGLREIGVEMQIVAQLRHAQKFRAHVRAGEAEWRFAPVGDHERFGSSPPA